MFQRNTYEIQAIRRGQVFGVAVVEARSESEAVSQLRKEARRDGLGTVTAGAVRATESVRVHYGDPAPRVVAFRDAAYWREP